MSVTTPAALELCAVSRRFGGLQALRQVSCVVRRGTVHALLGENGAGKTTLMRIAFGMLRADEGTVAVHGVILPLRTPAEALAAGIGMVHQHFTLVPAMTVAENLTLGGTGRWNATKAAARVRVIAERTGFALDPGARVENLSVGAQQRVEIAKALAAERTILVLDEPTAVLAPREIDDLLEWLRRFAAAGNSVVLITHKLREALAVADDVTVLRGGEVVLSRTAHGATVDLLTAAIIGSAATRDAPRSRDDVRIPPTPSGVVFRGKEVVLADQQGIERLRTGSFVIHAGEMVGVVGVEGSGQREFLRALAGRLAPTAGTLDRPAHVGFVPEDRHQDAMLLERSLTENVALRGAGGRRGMMAWSRVHAATTQLIAAFDVRAPGADTPMRALSGGNQQKLVLARELDARDDLAEQPRGDVAPTTPRAIVVENPTRGLDVRATDAVHARLRSARDEGAAIVVYSSDLDEVLALASRVFVAYAGTLREVSVLRDEVGRAMLGLP